MGKRSKSKKRVKSGNWKLPKGAKNYFSASSDDEFKEKHLMGYGFAVALGIHYLPFFWRHIDVDQFGSNGDFVKREWTRL